MRGRKLLAARSIAETQRDDGRAKLHNKGVVVCGCRHHTDTRLGIDLLPTAVFTDPVSADLRLSPSWFYGSVSAALLLSGLSGRSQGA